MEKKGLSTVISTALLILITITAVVILAGIFIPFTKNSLDNTECFELRDYFAFSRGVGLGCYKVQGNMTQYIVSVRVNTNEERDVKGLVLRFLRDDGSGDLVYVREGQTAQGLTMLNDVGGGVLIVPSKKGEYSTATYVYTADAQYTKVEVFPLLNEQTCDVSDALELAACGEGT